MNFHDVFGRKPGDASGGAANYSLRKRFRTIKEWNEIIVGISLVECFLCLVVLIL